MFLLRYKTDFLTWHFGLAFFLLVLTVSPGNAKDSEPFKLTRNPFDYSAMNPLPNAQKKGYPQKIPTVQLELRATLVSAQQSIANINGKHLVPGETIEQYRLLTVTEGEAILIKNGERTTLSMKEAASGLK